MICECFLVALIRLLCTIWDFGDWQFSSYIIVNMLSNINTIIALPLFQIVELSIRLIVMWSVPFNLNLYDTHMGLAMIYNQGPFSSSSYWFNKMYYSDIGPHVRGFGGKVRVNKIEKGEKRKVTGVKFPIFFLENIFFFRF